MGKLFDEFIRCSHYVGARSPFWTQGAGGNISFKEGNFLWIKATGTRLDEVKDDNGVAKVNLREIRSGLHKCHEAIDPEGIYSNLLREVAVQGRHLGRPSMETGFHSILNRVWVIHFHSIVGLIMAHESRNNRTIWEQWLKKRALLSISVIEPVLPGLELAMKVRHFDSDALLLENHGVILVDDGRPFRRDSVIKKWMLMEKYFCEDWKYADLLDLIEGGMDIKNAMKFLSRNSIGSLRLYFPDSVVFYDRIKGILDFTCDGKWVLSNSDRGEEDRDAKELWLATRILDHWCPDLRELPKKIADQINKLPSEMARKDVSSYG